MYQCALGIIVIHLCLVLFLQEVETELNIYYFIMTDYYCYYYIAAGCVISLGLGLAVFMSLSDEVSFCK